MVILVRIVHGVSMNQPALHHICLIQSPVSLQYPQQINCHHYPLWFDYFQHSELPVLDKLALVSMIQLFLSFSYFLSLEKCSIFMNKCHFFLQPFRLPLQNNHPNCCQPQMSKKNIWYIPNVKNSLLQVETSIPLESSAVQQPITIRQYSNFGSSSAPAFATSCF
jgi:hypothetical protein